MDRCAHIKLQDPSTHGVIVQLPLPASMDANVVCSEVSPIKDVDCFTPENVGKLCHGNPLFVPCAPKAVLSLLEEAQTPLEGQFKIQKLGNQRTICFVLTN